MRLQAGALTTALLALYPNGRYLQPSPESGNWYEQDRENSTLRVLVGSEIWWRKKEERDERTD